MAIFNLIIVSLWVILWAYWIISAFTAKKSVTQRAWWKSGGPIRLILFVLIVLALRSPSTRHILRDEAVYTRSTPLMGFIGLVLTALGIGFAIWSRAILGRNWGMPMTRRKEPELVTTGPYAFVRHPIYTGMLVAMIGSAMGQSVFWVPPLILIGCYFLYSAKREEKIMAEEFPEQYPAYMKRTKMLLPYLL